jgi:hypothetical protein
VAGFGAWPLLCNNTATSSPDADTQHQTKQPPNKAPIKQTQKKFCITESATYDATASATVQKGLTGTNVATYRHWAMGDASHGQEKQL